MEISKSIIVLGVNPPWQLCYTGHLPGLFAFCESSKNWFCNLKGPEFGCTRNASEACRQFHLCNTPDVVFVILGFFLALALILFASGCFWCCFCCCCGRCCRDACPCFAGRSFRRIDVVAPHNLKVNVPPWNMYSGLDNVKLEKIS